MRPRFPFALPASLRRLATEPDARAAAARQLALFLFVVAALALGLVFLLEAVPEAVKASAYPPWDGFIDWGGAREMLAGRDPYSPASLSAIGLSPEHGLGHPPTALIWFYPFAHLDRMAMKSAFTAVTMVMLLYHVALVSSELELPLWPLTTLVVFAYVYQTDWFILHLLQVDLSELIAFLYVLCWYFLRRGRDDAAGVMLGLACTLKLYPALVVVFLVGARRWRAVVAAGITYGIFAVEVIRRLGPRSFAHFIEQTGSYAQGWMSTIRNASIDGIVHRWFYPLWRQHREGHPVRTDATLIAAAISLAMFGLAWAASTRSVRAARSDPRRIDHPFALFSVLSMVPGPYQWEHYNVTLILPFLVLLADALNSDGRRRWLRLGILSAVLLVVAWLLDVDYHRRVVVGDTGGQGRIPILEILFYEISAWLPWFILCMALGVRLLQRDRLALKPIGSPPSIPSSALTHGSETM